MSLLVFFFKQKTAYELRISDWSSDVCSSDLLSLIERSHGPGIRYDIINAEVGRSLDKVIEEAKLRVAGTPNLEPKTEGVEEGVMAFSATFEVYPEVQVPDLSALQVKRAKAQVGDTEVQHTVDILRKQRAQYEARSEEQTSELQSLMRNSYAV